METLRISDFKKKKKISARRSRPMTREKLPSKDLFPENTPLQKFPMKDMKNKNRRLFR